MKKKISGKKAHRFLVFRKWGGKNFSLFNTLKKEIVISVLSVCYLISVPIQTMAVVQDTSEVKMEYDLDEIEISAQRSPAFYSQLARIISVIERKEIEASPVQSIQEILEYVAGVDIRQRGSEGIQADISIRGGTFDQTLILLNGINISDPQTGHHHLNLPIDILQIDRIEILEGPAARVFGPNSFSGAINIVSKKPESNGINFFLGGGENGLFNANLSGEFKTGNLSHLAAINRKSAKGYIENTDFKSSSFYYANNFGSKKGKISNQMAYSEKGFGANSFYTPKYPNQYEETKTFFTSLKWESFSKMHITPAIYYRRHHDRFELFRDNPASWYKNHNYHLTNVFGASLNSWIQWQLGKTSLGAEIRSENILSNVLGVKMEKRRNVPGENAEFTKSATRNNTSVFFEHVAYVRNWSLSSGLMANYISGSHLGINVFPGLDVGYDISKFFRLYSSFNTALRMPTFTDLYYEGPTNIGNPELKPERSQTFETGLKLNSKFVKGNLNLFYRKGKDIIDWVKTNNDDIWQAQNLTVLNSFGTELGLQFFLKDNLGKGFPNKISLSYFYNNLNKENQDFISNYVLDNLKHKFVCGLNQNLLENLTLDLRFTFQDREGTFTMFKNTVGEEVDYSAFGIFDGKVNYKKKNFSYFISVNNLFNKQYYDIGNVIQPGRWIKTGISYRIGFN